MSGYTSAYLCDATENCIVIFVITTLFRVISILILVTVI